MLIKHSQEELSRVDPQATLAAYILSSDKTQLSVFSGDKKAWPVYLTLGNISRCIRRQPSKQATILLGYLPVPKLDCFTSPDARRTQNQELFHCCMENILKPIINLRKEGVDMRCADGAMRHIYPDLASYIADWPEQCLVAGCLESRCPICKVPTNERGHMNETSPALRIKQEALHAIAANRRTGYSSKFVELGLRPSIPFWAKLQNVNMYMCFTPDALHQLHKGIFGDHLVKWCTGLIGGKELDRRYKAMPKQHGLRHFTNGISYVTQWTGREHKNMEKVFITALSGLDEPQAVKAAKAILDFICISQFSQVSEIELEAMNDALELFHDLKDIFTDRGVSPNGFHRIPKLHMLSHYTLLIRELGATDGYSTEYSERLHIDFAKVGYRASNRVNAVKQMALYLQRQEAVKRHESDLISRHQLSGYTPMEQMGERDKAEDGKEMRIEVRDVAIQDVVSQHRQGSRHTAPKLWHAKRANHAQVRVQWVLANHHAINLLHSVRVFLTTQYPSLDLSVSLDDRIDLWTRIKLHHQPPPFGSVGDPPVVEIIRATAAKYARQNNRIIIPGVFDTVLVSDNSQEKGLHRKSRLRRIKDIDQIQSRIPSGPHSSHFQITTTFGIRIFRNVGIC